MHGGETVKDSREINPEKIRAALQSGGRWPQMKRAVAALTDAELAEADRIERLGNRRENTLLVLKGERHKRQGRSEKMLHLKVEARI
jgi:hypothetical protein